MKRSLQRGVRAVLLCLLFVAVAASAGACGKKAHKHTYAETWESDGQYHWHAATCEHTDKVSGKAAHDGDPCSVCGYTAHTHTYAETWESDGQYHWHAATCGHTNEISGKAEHSGNPCSVCGYVKPTAGVTYALSGDGESAAATGIGTATDATVYIASEYKGKPVTEIAANAFRNYEVTENGTTSSSMPSSVTCFVLPDSVTEIGDTAFFNSRCVTKVVFGKNVRRIGDSAFSKSGLSGELLLPEKLEEIGKSAFASLAFSSVHFPASLHSVGAGAFTNVQSITSEPNGELYAAGNCLIERATKTLVCGSDASVIPDDGSVEHIGESAFLYREKLTSIALPASLKTVGKTAFYKCTSLCDVILPEGVTSLGEQSFYGCAKLHTIVVPASLASVGKEAFLNAVLECVYYAGETQAQWNTIKFATGGGLTFGDGSDVLKDATRYYYSETAPTGLNPKWHWVDGVPTLWE